MYKAVADWALFSFQVTVKVIAINTLYAVQYYSTVLTIIIPSDKI